VFAQRLMPVLWEHQVDSGQLQIMPVVNVVPWLGSWLDCRHGGQHSQGNWAYTR